MTNGPIKRSPSQKLLDSAKSIAKSARFVLGKDHKATKDAEKNVRVHTSRVAKSKRPSASSKNKRYENQK